MFPGPAGSLEGLWKEAAGTRRGAAVFAHPHPLHGGTMHNKVVYRAVKALTQSGYATLRFQFRGVGLSEGRHDAGRGEVEDVRAAVDEAQRRGGTPILAGGFSFGAAMALRAADGDPRVVAFLGLGLPVATESGA
ncbi:MAG: alpha/beta fold hydrolase [Acidobacteriota bacterium]